MVSDELSLIIDDGSRGFGHGSRAGSGDQGTWLVGTTGSSRSGVVPIRCLTRPRIVPNAA